MSTEFKLHADFQRFNFFRVPDWRWVRAMWLADRWPTPGRCSRRDDDFVRKARAFLLKWRDKDIDADREELWFDEPGLYYAYQFFVKQFEERGPTCFLQARILSGQTDEEIAKAMVLTPDTVRWYEALFFNVRDRLQSRDWITQHVLIPAYTKVVPGATTQEEGSATPFKDSAVALPFVDASLRLFSYFGGPLVAEAMITGMRGDPYMISRDDYANWMDRTWSDGVRRRSAQAVGSFEVNKYNVMELFAVHASIVALDRSDETKDQQKSAIERHIKEMIDEIPWSTGQDGEKLYEGTVLGRLDNMAAELRDDEVLRIAAGETIPGLTDNFPDRLPPPRKQREAIIMQVPKSE